MYVSLPVVRLDALTYDQSMSATSPVSVSDARDQLASIIDRARDEHEPIFLWRRGKRVAAVIDSDDLERLIELAEDMEDIRAAEESRAEMLRTKAEPIPWDQVKADLGLV
jgi:prevent-host-death family protein